MTIEELRKEDLRLFAIWERRMKEAEVARDAWYSVHRRWIDATEEENINKIIESRLNSKKATEVVGQD
jgi:hypothetical protein